MTRHLIVWLFGPIPTQAELDEYIATVTGGGNA